LYEAAVAGARTDLVTSAAAESLQIERGQRIWLFAAGKAAHAMAAATLAVLHSRAQDVAGGVIVSTELAPSPFARVEAMRGDHPVPGRNSFAAAERIGELAAGTRSTDVAIVLISGGASSLIAAPLPGSSESDLSRLYEMLLASGLDITAMNAVRKRFARWGGGRLAVALAPARTHCFIVSDVIGDDPSSIGSGPCVPDPCVVTDVVNILEGAALTGRLPAALGEHLDAVTRGAAPETPKGNDPAFVHVTARVIANNRGALDAAAARARGLGVRAVDIVGEPLRGNAAARGADLARDLLSLREHIVAEGAGPACRIWGGETTVALRAAAPWHDADTSGQPMPMGGRCQELALAVARVLAQAGERSRGIVLLAAGTDGRDGPTDAAGAFADDSTWAAIRTSGRDPETLLANHESYAALDAAHALLRFGPTGTNVMDVVIGYVA
jgi:glycerate 2-kinase